MPELFITVNAAAHAEVYHGWPLIVHVELFHPDAIDEGSQPLRIAAPEGPWTAALQLVVRDQGGRGQQWPLELRGATAEAVSLALENPADLYWCLSPEQTAAIREGQYELSCTLDTRKSVGEKVWKGLVRSDSALVRIRVEPAELDAVKQSEKAQLLAVYRMLRGESGLAMAPLDDLLQRQPDDLGALELKADLLADAGKTEEALGFYSKAIGAFLKKYGSGEPPQILLSKQSDLLEKMFSEAPEFAGSTADKPMQSALVEHSLRAGTPAGEHVQTPFPAEVGKLRFKWKLPGSFRDDPVEVYWFAADTGPVAPANYLIASDKSQSGAASGTFSLSAPKKGFPPGTYRLELWQAGGVLHREQFIIIAAQVPNQLSPAEKTERGRTGLAVHFLWAETVVGKTSKQPLPADSKRLVFTWTLSDAAPQEQIEGRWIAANISGAAPANHLIGSSKFTAGKRSGQFTLSAPKNGFPPGSYRLELWQSGNRLHTDTFTIGK